MITEDYVSFETAKLLKEKGFDEYTLAYYDETGIFEYDPDFLPNGLLCPTFCSAPTLGKTMKWLREMHNIHIGDNITYTENPEKFPPKYYVYVSDTKTGDTLIKKECCLAQKNLTPKSFDSPEEACEAAIKYCLENLI